MTYRGVLRGALDATQHIEMVIAPTEEQSQLANSVVTKNGQMRGRSLLRDL